jgi:polyadenylate-binding protein
MAATQPYASASLYVGDLAPEVTEALLFEIFKTIGPVASIRVCRDSLTRRSLGYAYVNFHNVADAERAVEQLNYSLILNRPCRIMWSHRDPAKRKSGVGNIFIKNLDKSIDNSVLSDTFSTFGHILSCKVEMDANGVSKGYGYVHYETQEEADNAIAKVNGMLMVDKKVYVGPFQPRKERTSEESKQKFTNVYVKNLDTSVTREQFEQKFAEFGHVTSAVIVTNEKEESKGFGFVNFEKPEEAQKAVEALNGSLINGKPVYVGRAQKKHEREEELRHQRLDQLQKYQGVNVYVKNLEDSVDDDRVRQEFAKFGTITSAKVMRDEKGNSKGFGFICFGNPEEATRAVTEMNGNLLQSKPLYVGLAQRKDIRRAQLEALHNQKLSQLRMAPQGVMPPIYPGGQPVFFQPGMPPQGPRMMYQQMVPRQPRFNQGPAGGPPPAGGAAAAGGGGGAQQGAGPRQGGGFQQGMPNFVVPMGAGGQPRQQQQRGPRAPRTQGGPTGGPGQGQGAQGGPVNGQPNRPQAPPNASARGFKYTSTARNQVPGAVPIPAGQNIPPQQPFPPQLAPGIQTTPEQLEAQMGNEESKQMIGEQLYSLISRAQPIHAGKITGMLLESLELRDLLGLLQNRPALEGKIQEAVAVLEESQG